MADNVLVAAEYVVGGARTGAHAFTAKHSTETEVCTVYGDDARTRETEHLEQFCQSG